jgi:hypothetical protein
MQQPLLGKAQLESGYLFRCFAVRASSIQIFRRLICQQAAEEVVVAIVVATARCKSVATFIQFQS